MPADTAAAIEPPLKADDDHRVVWWANTRLYLGPPSAQIHRLFWLLANPPGRIVTMDEVHYAISGEMNYYADEKNNQRIRKAISKLRARMQEWELDNHFVIHAEGAREHRTYRFIRATASLKRRVDVDDAA